MRNEHILDSGEIRKRKKYKEYPKFSLKKVGKEIAFGKENERLMSWYQMKSGGVTFNTHRLSVYNQHQVKFKPSFGVYFWGGVSSLVGICTMLYASSVVGLIAAGFMILIGGVFVLIGFSIMDQPVFFFDKKLGLFSKRETFFSRTFKEEDSFSVKLDDINSVQFLINEKGDDTSIFYEVNLILKDNNRINVLNHGSEEDSFQDGKNIAKFLEVPLYMLVNDRVVDRLENWRASKKIRPNFEKREQTG